MVHLVVLSTLEAMKRLSHCLKNIFVNVRPPKYLKDYKNIINMLYLFAFIYFKTFKANLICEKIQTYENKEVENRKFRIMQSRQWSWGHWTSFLHIASLLP